MQFCARLGHSVNIIVMQEKDTVISCWKCHCVWACIDFLLGTEIKFRYLWLTVSGKMVLQWTKMCVFVCWLGGAEMKIDIGDMEVFDECDEA